MKWRRIGRGLINRKTLLLLLVLNGVLWLAAWVISLTKLPAEGTITKSTDDQVQAQSENNGVQVYDGPNLSFSLAGDYSRRQIKDDATGGGLFFVSKHAQPSRQLAVEIAVGRPLADDPSYRLRNDTSPDYTKQIRQFNGESVIEFNRTGGTFERVAYWQHKGKFAIVALTANNGGPSDELTREFDAILASLSWKDPD